MSVKRISDITEEIIKANGNELKIEKILKDNLMISSELGHLRAVVQECSEYPCISIFTCNEEGDTLDEVSFTEINIENKQTVTYSYDLDDEDEDSYSKTINFRIK